MNLIEFITAFVLGVSAPVAPYAAADYGVEGFTGKTVVVAAPEPAAPVVESEPVAAPERTVEPVASRSQTRQPVQQAQQPAQRQQVNPAPTKAPELPAVPKAATGGVMAAAAAYVGTPYSLPSSPPATFDCSSYVSYVYAQAGRSIPSSVNGLKGFVTPVSTPQPGDIVFFNDYHHVALYAGGGMWYEARNATVGVVYNAAWTDNVWYGRP